MGSAQIDPLRLKASPFHEITMKQLSINIRLDQHTEDIISIPRLDKTSTHKYKPATINLCNESDSPILWNILFLPGQHHIASQTCKTLSKQWLHACRKHASTKTNCDMLSTGLFQSPNGNYKWISQAIDHYDMSGKFSYKQSYSHGSMSW